MAAGPPERLLRSHRALRPGAHDGEPDGEPVAVVACCQCGAGRDRWPPRAAGGRARSVGDSDRLHCGQWTAEGGVAATTATDRPRPAPPSPPGSVLVLVSLGPFGV